MTATFPISNLVILGLLLSHLRWSELLDEGSEGIKKPLKTYEMAPAFFSGRRCTSGLFSLHASAQEETTTQQMFSRSLAAGSLSFYPAMCAYQAEKHCQLLISGTLGLQTIFNYPGPLFRPFHIYISLPFPSRWLGYDCPSLRKSLRFVEETPQFK